MYPCLMKVLSWPVVGLVALLWVANSAMADDASHAAPASPSRQLADWKTWPLSALQIRDATAAPDVNHWLTLQAAKGASRAGIILQAADGGWNLTEFGEIVVPVRNLSDHVVRVVLRLDGDRIEESASGQRLTPPALGETLPVGSEPVWLRLPLGSRKQAAWADKLFAMQCNPAEFSRRGSIDAAKVTAVQILLPEAANERSVAVGAIEVRGSAPRLENATVEQAFPFIDEFGQYIHRDWPGKLHAEPEFAQRRAEEAKDLATHPRPADWDSFGGWLAGPKLKATGFFRVEKIDGWWWLIDPEGRLFWSHGAARVGTRIRVGSVYHGTPVSDREIYFRLPKKDSPLGAFFDTEPQASRGYYLGKEGHTIYDHLEANLFRKYGPQWKEEYAQKSQQRLASWALNSIANSSDPAIFSQRKTPYTAIVYSVPLGRPEHRIAGATGDWGGLPDPFDPGLGEAIKRTLHSDLKKVLNDPWCLGFFVDNELHWGDRCYPAETTLISPASQPAKKTFVGQLKSKYKTIADLNAAWGTQHASWDALLASTAKPDRKQKAVAADLESFSAQIVEAYFRLCRDSVRAASPHHLYLGCRFAGWNPLVIDTAAKYVDVISINRYTYSVANLTLPEGIDRPLVIGEFSFCGLDRGAGWPSWFLPVPDQQHRAAAYCAYLESALRNPAIVGAHWFQFYDQPTAGRFDGENFQMGLVDITDTPYPETIQACRTMGAKMYSIRHQAGQRSVGKADGERIANDHVSFSLSSDGRKFELGFVGEAASLSGDRGLFDMMVGAGTRHEWAIDPVAQMAVVSREGAALVARYAKLIHDGKEHDLDVELRFTLENDAVACEAKLRNNSELTIEEFWFPWVGPFRSLGPEPAQDTLILPEGFGRRIQNPAAYVSRFHTGYMAPDQKRVLACSHYPGGWMTMGWFGLYGGGKALGFLSLDETFQTTGLNLARDSQSGLLSAGFVRYPFLKQGRWQSPRSLLRLHHSDWHDDARNYRHWVDSSWWSQSKRPQWVDQMHGWQRIIMKHQYGEIFYRYKDLLDVFEAGRPYGIKTLFVFGWFRGGMDNGYPEYLADEELGGETGLRQAIAEVQRRGGRVILYANGHLIDVDSDYYQKTGKRICLKTSQGSEYRESYKFSGDGTFLRSFGARSFVAACQSTPEWRQRLIEIGRYMASFGADGIFYDQMGGHVPYLCFDKSHPHAGPALAQGPGKNGNLAAIRHALIDGHPERTFGTELTSDCLNRHVDFIHTCVFGMSPGPETMPEMFHYTFPEILFSCREIRDESDHVRRMNWAFLYGRRFDVEIWRCRGDLRQTPAYGAYMAKLIALRDRWPDLLMTGRFIDEDGLDYDHQSVTAKAYVAGNRLAVVVWNHTTKEQTISPKLSRRFVEGATVTGPCQPGDRLPAQSVAVLVYE